MTGEADDKHAVDVRLSFSTEAVSALARILVRGEKLTLSEILEEAVLFRDAAMLTMEHGGKVVLRTEAGDEVTLPEERASPHPHH